MSVRPLVCTALACGTILLNAGPAAAHAELKSSDPADGATLATAPTHLTLTFTEGASATRSSVLLAGRSLPLTQRTGHPDVLLADLSAAAPRGAVTVTWRSVSSDDGHVATGTLHFTFGTASPAAVVRAPVKDTPTGAGLDSTAVLYGGGLGLLCLAFGSVLFVTVRRARRE